MQIFTHKVVVNSSIRSLCVRPYPNHPKGCPNFWKKETCPPQVGLLGDIYDISKGFRVVWVEFDFGNHRIRMGRKHPNWSQRQVDCCLYWQGGVKKKLREEIQDVMYYLEGRGDFLVTDCPEAMGVNVTETMRNIGVNLEWPPEKIVRKIALIGERKKDGMVI